MTDFHSPQTAERALLATIALTVGGAISGMLSAVLLTAFRRYGELFLPGVLFATALAVHVWFVARPRSLGAVGAIFCWSMGAYSIALMTPLILGEPWTLLSFGAMDTRDFEYSEPRRALIAAGAIGGSITSLGFLWLAQPRVSAARLALEVGFCAVAGALLARAGPIVHNFHLVGGNWKAVTLVLWQTGMACALGTLVVLRAGRQPTSD